MNRMNHNIQGKSIFCFFLLLLFVTACNKSKIIKENPQEERIEICKFDATRIINKILDSTNIAYLYRFDEKGRFAIYKNDFIKQHDVQITSKRYYLSDDCDSLEHSIEARLGKCWFLEFIQIDSVSENIYRLHYAIPYKERGGFYDFNINDYSIVDSLMIRYKAASDTVRYIIGMIVGDGTK